VQDRDRRQWKEFIAGHNGLLTTPCTHTDRQTDRQTERERDDDDDDDGDDRRRSPARCTRLRCEAVDKRS